MTASLTKYKRHTPNYDKATWVMAWDMVEDSINKQARGGTLRKYTLEEAMAVMDGSKACGWPMCMWFQTKEQAWSSPKFLEAYNIFNDALYRGERVENFDTIFLKDEMRPIAKCASGMARTVFCQDVVSATWAVQHNKMLDQRLIQNCQDSVIGDGAIVVGMSPYGNSFQQLTYKFKDCICFELDGKAWDCNMFPDVHQENARIRCKLYGYDEKTTNAIKLYYGQVSHTTSVLPDGSLEYRMSGNPSGQANTTIDNSMWTMGAFKYGLIRVMAMYGIIVTSKWFNTYIRLIVFGDDIIFGMLKTLLSHHKIDPKDFIEKFQMVQNLELGLTYTASLPSPLTDLNWLNLGWGFNRGQWWPMPDRVKILNSLLVTREQRNAHATLERVISIRNNVFGDPELYEYIDKYMSWLTSQYGYFDKRSGILTHTELFNLFTGSQLLVHDIDWDVDAGPVNLHKSA